MLSTSMKKCQECDLPTQACNALAMYRKAVQFYKLGRSEEAGNFAKLAAEYERAYTLLNGSRTEK